MTVSWQPGDQPVIFLVNRYFSFSVYTNFKHISVFQQWINLAWPWRYQVKVYFLSFFKKEVCLYPNQNPQVLEHCITTIRGHDFGQGVGYHKKDRSLRGELFYIKYDQQQKKKNNYPININTLSYVWRSTSDLRQLLQSTGYKKMDAISKLPNDKKRDKDPMWYC